MKKIKYSLMPGSSAGMVSHLVCFGALGLLAGCVAPRESRVVSSAPPPSPTGMTVTTTTQPAQGNVTYVTHSPDTPDTKTIIVTQAPPALQQEVVLARPSAQHQWIDGYWMWQNDRYEWMTGHWELPPEADSVWVKPRWEQNGNAYRFYKGYWTK